VAIEGPPYAVVNVAVENVSTAPGTRLILKPLSTGNAWVANVGMEKAFTLDAGGKLILSVEADGESSNGGAPLLTCVTASAGEEGALVAYALARPAFIEAEILNIAGRSVKKLTTGSVQVSGRGTLVWNGLNQWGARVPAGLYLATLEARSPDGSRQRAIVPITMRRR
jgi:hypothetical protein